MSKPKPRLELPPEAEPARDVIEALVTRYEDQIDRLQSQFRQLTKQVESLTDQVEKLTPRNSSLPPSTEHPHAKPKRKRLPAKKRKQGGKNGHKRHFRELIPSEQCTAVTPCHPDAFRRYGGELQPDGATLRRHQVWDLPPIEPVSSNISFSGATAHAAASRRVPAFRRECRPANVVPAWRLSPGC